MSIVRRFRVIESFRHYNRRALAAEDEQGFVMRRASNKHVKLRTFIVDEVVELTSPQDDPERIFAYWIEDDSPIITKDLVETMIKEGLWEEISTKTAPVT